MFEIFPCIFITYFCAYRSSCFADSMRIVAGELIIIRSSVGSVLCSIAQNVQIISDRWLLRYSCATYQHVSVADSVLGEETTKTFAA